MDTIVAIGSVVVALGSIFGIIKPMLQLNATITELNVNFSNMLKADEKRDDKIKNTREELFKVKDRVTETEHELANHETRILVLENKRKGTH